MINKLRNYILFLLVVVLIPSVVSAHTLKFGDPIHENGTTTIPVNLTADSDLAEGYNASISCEVTGASCAPSYAGVDAMSSSGTLMKEVTSGTTIKIANIILTNSGYNEVSVTPVIKGNGTSATTSTYIKGKQALKTDSKLSSLTPSQGTMYPAFNSDVKDYTIYNIKDTIVSFRLNYTCDSCDISAENYGSMGVNRGTNQINISSVAKGNNTLTLVVKSQDGSNSTNYNFTIIRGDTSYNSAKLSALDFGDYRLSPEFKKNTTEYTLEVPYSVKDLTEIINATLEDSDAEVEIDGESNLAIGENTVTIKIVSVNGDNKEEYKITVVRLSSDDIIVKRFIDSKITFVDAEGETQELDQDDFKKLYPNVWKDIEEGKYKWDNKGYVMVEEEKEEKEDKKLSKNTIIIIVIVSLSIIVIGLSGYFLFRKKDPEKEKKKQEEKIKKKAEKRARKDELKKLEAEYYNEYYGDEDEDYEDEEDEEEEEDKTSKKDKKKSKSVEIDEEDKLSKEETDSLLEDDYIFESSLLEDDIEEVEIPKKKKNEVIDVDSALEDLMNTKTYDFSEELRNIDDEDEEDE